MIDTEKFYKSVYKTTNCWFWIGCLNGTGYGSFPTRGQVLMAHRASWLIHKGSIPPGLFVLHECDTRQCVNPEHLRLGTNLENMQQASKSGIAFHFPKTVCKHGHDQTVWGSVKKTQRFCLLCARASNKRCYERRCGRQP